MLQDGYSDTTVNVVVTAGMCPWNILFIPDWLEQGLLSLDKPGDEGAGLRCYELSAGLKDENHALP